MLKFFMWWARRWQLSCLVPVTGLVPAKHIGVFGYKVFGMQELTLVELIKLTMLSTVGPWHWFLYAHWRGVVLCRALCLSVCPSVNFSCQLHIFLTPWKIILKHGSNICLIETMSGCPRSGKKSGKKIFFQGQGTVREFWNLSGNFGI